MPTFVKGYLKAGRLTKGYTKRGLGKIKRAAYKGGTLNVSDRGFGQRTLRLGSIDLRVAASKQSVKARRQAAGALKARKQILNDTYR